MTAIIIGLLSVALGVFGAMHWSGDVITLIKGLLPVSFICGGIVAILAGISSLRK